MSDVHDGRLAVRPREAARLLGISTRTLSRLTQEGRIRGRKVAPGKQGAMLYRVADLQAWLDQQAEGDE